jgi:hypothetical protein
MTVCTNHVALCHLVENALPSPVSKAVADAELLVSQMVELKDDRIGLAAVHARVLSQKGNQVLDPPSDGCLPAFLGRIDISLAVRCIVLLLVGGPARAAVAVPLAF